MTQMQRLLTRLGRIHVPDDNVRSVLTAICMNASRETDGSFLPVCAFSSDRLFDALVTACETIDVGEIDASLRWLEDNDLISIERPTEEDCGTVWINWYKFGLLSSDWLNARAWEA